MKADDLTRDGEADTRAIGFGREEWREDVFGHLGRDRLPVVGNLDLDAFLGINGGAHGYLAVAILRQEGLGGVFSAD